MIHCYRVLKSKNINKIVCVNDCVTPRFNIKQAFVLRIKFKSLFKKEIKLQKTEVMNNFHIAERGGGDGSLRMFSTHSHLPAHATFCTTCHARTRPPTACLPAAAPPACTLLPLPERHMYCCAGSTALDEACNARWVCMAPCDARARACLALRAFLPRA